MAISSHTAEDQPPTPGGDPDQPPSDLPVPRTGQKETKKRDRGYGHIETDDEPRPEGAPQPHQIF